MPLLADVSAGGKCCRFGMPLTLNVFFIHTLRKRLFIADIQT